MTAHLSGPQATTRARPSLTANDVWFRYADTWVLRGATIEVGPGEIVGLWGPSGSGKSTLAQILAGRLKPARGTVSLAASRGRAHPVQLVSQQADRAVNPRWKIRAVLEEAAGDLTAVIDSGLVLPGWLDAFPHELSGGELQRVNVARALLARPQYVVADETTASLDAITQARIWRILSDGVSRGEYGILAVSHDRPLLETAADRIVAIDELG